MAAPGVVKDRSEAWKMLVHSNLAYGDPQEAYGTGNALHT